MSEKKEQAVTPEVVDNKESTAVVPAAAETTAVTVAKPQNYITGILTDIKQSFLEVNEGLDLDFVRMGDWLKISKKGNFIEAADETVSYGDTIDVVIGMGEQRWSLWGDEGSPEDGLLIVARPKLDEAKVELAGWLEMNPQAAERYDLNSIQLRYMAYVIPVSTLGPDDFPKVYLMSFSPTDTYTFAHFAMGLFQGKAASVGVPRRTPVNGTVVRLKTAERKGKGNNNQWIGIDFEAIGLFKPEDYGITPDQA